jgi:hypothetical protein
MTDVDTRIAALSDDDAVAVLAVVLHEDDATFARRDELKRAEEIIPEALPQADFVDAGEVRRSATAGTVPDRGELARATLSLLAAEAGMADEIKRAIDAGRTVLHRDLVTLAVGGLVLAALTRVHVKLDRDKQGRWAFSFEIKPAEDSGVAGLIEKLFTFSLGG